MEFLPDELLMMIFDRVPSRDLLGSVILVCRRWNALAKKRALLIEDADNYPKLNKYIHTIQVVVAVHSLKGFLLYTASIAPYIRDLSLHAINQFGPEHFATLSKLRHLDHLDIFLRDRILDTQLVPVMSRLSSVVINDVVSARVLRGLAATRRLRQLHMFGRSRTYPQREILIFINAKQHILTNLTLRCKHLKDATYAAIGMCENLTSLQLYTCQEMTTDGIMPLTRLKRLQTLHVTGAPKVGSVALFSFIECLPLDIDELNLSATSFGDEHINLLAHRLPRLRVLELWLCSLTNQGAVKLAAMLQSLTMLDLDKCLTNQEITEIDSTHPNLLQLRCHTEYSDHIENFTKRSIPPPVPPPVTQRIRILVASIRTPYKYFRDTADGYRGSLFYYWSQNINLYPGNKTYCNVYDEDSSSESEDDYHYI